MLTKTCACEPVETNCSQLHVCWSDSGQAHAVKPSVKQPPQLGTPQRFKEMKFAENHLKWVIDEHSPGNQPSVQGTAAARQSLSERRV